MLVPMLISCAQPIIHLQNNRDRTTRGTTLKHMNKNKLDMQGKDYPHPYGITLGRNLEDDKLSEGWLLQTLEDSLPLLPSATTVVVAHAQEVAGDASLFLQVHACDQFARGSVRAPLAWPVLLSRGSQEGDGPSSGSGDVRPSRWRDEECGTRARQTEAATDLPFPISTCPNPCRFVTSILLEFGYS